MTKKEVPLVIPQMHPIPLTVPPHLTICTRAVMHPFPATIGLETVLPHIGELIFIDIALMIMAPDAQTTGYGAVGQDRGNVDACLAEKWIIADFPLIIP